VLATFIGTGMAAVAFGMSGVEWQNSAPDLFGQTFGFSAGAYSDIWATPALALWDNWFVLVPLALALFVGQLSSGWVFRNLLGLVTGGALVRRRLRRVGMYLSAVAVWEAPLLGAAAVVAMITLEEPAWAMDWLTYLAAVKIVLLLVAAVVLVGPALVVTLSATVRPVRSRGLYLAGVAVAGVLLIRASAWIELRGLEAGSDFGGTDIAAGTLAILGMSAMVLAALSHFLKRGQMMLLRVGVVWVANLVLQTAVWGAAVAGAFWVSGYVAIAVGSMVR
jgi:hypothetical protein